MVILRLVSKNALDDSHLHPYPRGNGAFSGLGAGPVCLGIILYFLTSPEIPGSSSAITQIRAIAPWLFHAEALECLVATLECLVKDGSGEYEG